MRSIGLYRVKKMLIAQQMRIILPLFFGMMHERDPRKQEPQLKKDGRRAERERDHTVIAQWKCSGCRARRSSRVV